MSDLITHYRDLAAASATRDPELSACCAALAHSIEMAEDVKRQTESAAKTLAIAERLDALSMADIRAMSTKDLDRLEPLLWHWASLVESERMARRRASREEESE